MCNPVVIVFSRRGCFIIPDLSLWISVLLCSPTAVSHCLFPVLEQCWEHEEVGDKRQDNGVVLFSVVVSEGLMFPTLFAVSRSSFKLFVLWAGNFPECFSSVGSSRRGRNEPWNGSAPPTAPGVAEGLEVSEKVSNQSTSQNVELFQL